MRKRILYNDLDGIQKVVQVAKSGSVSDRFETVWDESKHGKLPAGLVLGGQERQPDGRGFKLVVNSSKKSVHDAAKLAADTTKSVRDADKQALLDEIKKAKNASTVRQTVDALAALVEHLGLD